MKRFYHLLLAFVIAVIFMTPAVAAPKNCCGQSPVIILQGYSGPQLFLDAGTEREQQIWGPRLGGENTRSVLEVAFQVLPRLILDAGGNSDKVIEGLGEAMKLLEKMAMDDDGTSKYSVSAKPHGARDSRWDRMLESKQEKFNNQRAITHTLTEHIPADHIYVFACDWRQSNMQSIDALHEFIQEIKAESGHEKVSLFAVSYGGQLATAYFTYYGGADIDRAVLHSPAIRGTELMAELLDNEELTLDAVAALDMAAVFLQRELSIAQRAQDVSMEQISDIAVRILQSFRPLALNFGSLWDLVPMEAYDRLKARYLDPVKHADIIARADKIHYDMMPNAGETLRRMQLEGVKIAIISGCDVPLVTKNQVNSDFIIDIGSITGAKTQRLDSAAFFTEQNGEVCADPAHMHISPNGRVDASGAYLPEHTWFFARQYHAMAAWDIYASDLYCKWLFTDEIEDIYSSPAFPQFRESCNPSDGLEARFSESVSGYLTADDDTLLLKNLSKYSISLISVKAEGLKFEVPMVNRIVIAPGETARLRYDTALPSARRRFTITAEYLRESAVQSKETRTFDFIALPSHEARPEALRFPSAQAASVPARRFRPARALINAAIAGASVGFAALAVGVIMKGRLRED